VARRPRPADPEVGGWTAVSPSPIPFSETYPRPVALDEEGFEKVIADFAAADWASSVGGRPTTDGTISELSTRRSLLSWQYSYILRAIHQTSSGYLNLAGPCRQTRRGR
jgi:hypothetical protein